MVMERKRNGANHGHATTDGHAELGAAARTGAGSRPRPAALRARALCRAAEDRRWGVSAERCPRGPGESARSRYGLRLAGALPRRWPGGPEGPAAWRLPSEPTATRRSR